MNRPPLFLSLGLTALLWVSVLPTPAHAQTGIEEPGNAVLIVSPVLLLDISNATVTFPEPTDDDFGAGFVMSEVASSISHGANVPHNVEIAADTEMFQSQALGGPSAKPASDLQFDFDGGGWQPLSTAAQTLVANAAAGRFESVGDVTYRVALDLESDVPDTYDLDFTYTVIAD